MAITIHSRSIEITEELRELTSRRMHFALDTFGDRVESVAVNLSDVNGPRGGVDKRCHIAVVVRGVGAVVMVRSAGRTPALALTRAGRCLKYRIAEALRHVRSPLTDSIRRLPAAA